MALELKELNNNIDLLNLFDEEKKVNNVNVDKNIIFNNNNNIVDTNNKIIIANNDANTNIINNEKVNINTENIKLNKFINIRGFYVAKESLYFSICLFAIMSFFIYKLYKHNNIKHNISNENKQI
jgi:hypothetical protein